jgi:methylated-DNA-protein-cysteine methyltransferase-like protein
MKDSPEGVRMRIWGVIRKIPRGRVATYGQIAALAGIPGQPRRVSQALHAAADSGIPWQRVVSAGGVLGLARYDPMAGWEQRLRLEQEGVRFGRGGRVSLAEFGWKGRNVKRGRASKKPGRRKGG